MSAEYVFRISKEEISRRFDITMDVVYGRSVDKIMERVFGSTNVCDRWGFDRLDREALEAALKDGDAHNVNFCIHEAVPGRRAAVMLPVGKMQMVPGV